MEEMHHTHKEVAWGWIGAVLEMIKAGGEDRLRVQERILSPRRIAPRGLKTSGC